MRSEEELKYLLKKYNKGNCSPDEIRLLEVWFLEIGLNDGHSLSNAEASRMLDQLKQSPRFTNSPQAAVKIKSTYWQPLAVAASILSLIVFSWILRVPEPSHETEAEEMITVQTGMGEVKKIVLPDSSVIWLNAQTRLSYRNGFETHRSVMLDGEASFEVKRDETYPFIIHTCDSLETQVLGTRFNVYSYRQSGETEVAVKSGSVSVGKIGQNPQRILNKNETLLFHRQEQTWRHRYSNYNVKWITGEWELKGAGVLALALLLNNHYGIMVRTSLSKLESVEINANFHKGQSAEEIIITYCMLANCSYRMIDAQNIELY